MRYFIISGGTGRTGRNMLRGLIEHSEDFSDCAFRFSCREKSDTSLIDALPMEHEKMLGDVRDSDFADRLTKFGENATLIHIAGIDKSRLLVKYAIKNGVKHIVLMHTTGIYSKYKSASREYLKIEAEIEEMLKGTDIALTYMRPTMIYGNLADKNISTFIKLTDKFRLFPLVGGGKYELQPVFYGDLGKALFGLLCNLETAKGKNYILSGGHPLTLRKLLETISEQLGKKTVYFSVSYPLAYTCACILYFITFHKVDYRERVMRLVEPRVFSHELAQKELGYNPVDFAEGVKGEIEEYKKLKASKK